MSDPEELLEALLDSTSDFIMIADAQGRPVVFNRAYRDLMRAALGIEMQPGLKPHTLLPEPEQVASWDDLHRRVLGGEQFSIELAQAFPDEGERYFRVSFNPIVTGGEVTGFCEISHDITERVEVLTMMRENERVLRESQDVARIGSYRLDITSGLWGSTPMLDEIFGLEPRPRHGFDTWVELLHPDFREDMVRYFEEEVLGEGHPFDREYMIVRAADGAERWVHGLGRLERDPDGQITGMIGTIRDITDRKEMEQRLRQQEKLEAIGQLAGGVAHDFNNQLVAILGFADLIRARAGRDAELARFADHIVTSAKRAADLTSQLLAFSRKGRFLTVPVDLHRILFEVVNVLQHTIDKRIVVAQHLLATRALTLGDPSQLQNAVLNLALNARDAMPDGGQITFSTEVVDLDETTCERLPMPVEPGRYVRVGVADTGVGIEREHLQRIFEPFFTTKAAGEGTGMGLAAVYGTATTHKGCVSVQSEPGQGALFQLYLPQAPEAAKAPVETARGPASRHGVVRVLLVDDEASVREATVALLEAGGFQVTTCTDGADALSYYRGHWSEIDVVVLDMVMPALGGRDTFFAMQRINPDLRALLASGYSLDTEGQGLLQQGVRGILQKPFHMHEITNAILAALA